MFGVQPSIKDAGGVGCLCRAYGCRQAGAIAEEHTTDERPLRTIRMFPDNADTVLWISMPIDYEDTGLSGALSPSRACVSRDSFLPKSARSSSSRSLHLRRTRKLCECGLSIPPVTRRRNQPSHGCSTRRRNDDA
ncbi:hypothetical protein D3I60_14095 [Brevibacterium permense]|nr:hypothetical protein [Brevibacterium permense]